MKFHSSITPVVVVLLLVIFFATSSLPAEFQIVKIVDFSGKTLQIDSEIDWIPFGSLEVKKINLTDGPNNLHAGDQLRCVAADTIIHLQTADNSSGLTVTAPFHVAMVNDISGASSLIELYAGAVQSRGTTPTQIRCGDAIAGSRGTHYAVSVRREHGGNVAREITLLEGSLILSREGKRDKLLTETLANYSLIAGSALPRTTKVTSAQLISVASVIARLDAGTPQGLDKNTYAQLRSHYIATLNAPKQAENWTALLATQVKFDIVSVAAPYQIAQAKAASINDKEQFAAALILAADIYDRSGQPVKANEQRVALKQFDRMTVNKIAQRYHIAHIPEVVTFVDPIRKLVVRCSTNPQTTRPGRPTTLTVTVTDERGKPRSLAQRSSSDLVEESSLRLVVREIQ